MLSEKFIVKLTRGIISTSIMTRISVAFDSFDIFTGSEMGIAITDVVVLPFAVVVVFVEVLVVVDVAVVVVVVAVVRAATMTTEPF